MQRLIPSAEFKQKPKTQFDKLSMDTTGHIFSMLSPKDLWECKWVSKDFEAIVNKEIVIKKVYEASFGRLPFKQEVELQLKAAEHYNDFKLKKISFSTIMNFFNKYKGKDWAFYYAAILAESNESFLTNAAISIEKGDYRIVLPFTVTMISLRMGMDRSVDISSVKFNIVPFILNCIEKIPEYRDDFFLALARIYRRGIGVKQDKLNAEENYRIAAMQPAHNVEILFEWSDMLTGDPGSLKGIELLENFFKFSKEFESKRKDLATFLGMVYLRREAARRYNEEQGIHSSEKNLPQAHGWFTQALELGCGFAARALGVLYAAGNGVEKDITKAKSFFEQSIRLEHFEVIEDYVEFIPMTLEEIFQLCKLDYTIKKEKKFPDFLKLSDEIINTPCQLSDGCIWWILNTIIKPFCSMILKDSLLEVLKQHSLAFAVYELVILKNEEIDYLQFNECSIEDFRTMGIALKLIDEKISLGLDYMIKQVRDEERCVIC